MKALILSLLLFLTASAQNVWYVDRDATGANTGRSWADAWNYFDSSGWAGMNGVNWLLIGSGDTIYISGGTDSTVYTADHNGSPSRNWIRPPVHRSYVGQDEVVIARSWEAGHSGEVYIAAISYTDGGTRKHYERSFTMTNVSHVKVTGVIFADFRDDNVTSGISGLVYITDSLNTLDNCEFLTRGQTPILNPEGYHHTISNCLLNMIVNNSANATDWAGTSWCKTGHNIIGNTLIFRNGNMSTTAHKDVIQYSDIGLDDYSDTVTNVIANNLIIDLTGEGIGWNAIIYHDGYFGNYRYFIYNNIIVFEKQYTPFGCFRLNMSRVLWPNANGFAYIFNNTLILKGSAGVTPFSIVNQDTLMIKNNLVVIDTTIENFYNMDGTDGFPYCYKDIDYNYFAEYGGISGIFGIDNSLAKTFPQWQSDFNYDLHSLTNDSRNVVFTNKFGQNREDYYTEAGRDAGVDLSAEFPFLIYDAVGNLRTGAWDIGALEYTGGQSNNVRVRSKIFLQGPFDANSMSTILNQGSYLPNSQPYNQPPWNYNGNESFNSNPNPNMVDWVLVELRDASNPSQVIARRAALVRNDGTLLEPNGVDGVFFNNVTPGSYYIALYHRNHLSIMSSVPVQLSNNSTLYDFTTAMNKAYGQDPMVELTPGKFGMYASDGNSDGVINLNDRDDVWLIENGTMGYLGGDFNLNSGVTVHDVNQFWNMNSGKASQVP